MKCFVLAFSSQRTAEALKTPGLEATQAYFLRLLKPWIEVELVRLAPETVTSKSEADRRKVQEKEGTTLLEKWSRVAPPGAPLFLLDEGGAGWDTAEWAKRFEEWPVAGTRAVGFAIGGSLGFSPAVRSAARGKISLGAQTLPHELARVVLLEQIYRAQSILKRHPYHNAGE